VSRRPPDPGRGPRPRVPPSAPLSPARAGPARRRHPDRQPRLVTSRRVRECRHRAREPDGAVVRGAECRGAAGAGGGVSVVPGSAKQWRLGCRTPLGAVRSCSNLWSQQLLRGGRDAQGSREAEGSAAEEEAAVDQAASTGPASHERIRFFLTVGVGRVPPRRSSPVLEVVRVGGVASALARDDWRSWVEEGTVSCLRAVRRSGSGSSTISRTSTTARA